MTEATKDPLAVELGRRGGLARRSRQTPEERKETARLGGIARATRAAEQREREALLPGQVTSMMPIEITPWRGLKLIKGDVEEYIYKNWTHKIPRAYEELLQAAMKAGNLSLALQVLMAMTAMSPLTPGRLKQVAEKAIDRLSPEPDLSHLDDEAITLLRRLYDKGLMGAETLEGIGRKLKTGAVDANLPSEACPTNVDAEPIPEGGSDTEAGVEDCEIGSEGADSPSTGSSPSPASSNPTVATGFTRADFLAALGVSSEEARDGRTLLAALCRK